MESEDFKTLVAEALSNLPEEFRNKLENVDVVVQDWPTPRQLAGVGIRHRMSLLGLYEGVPHTRRTRGYNMVLPDKITIFRKPIEAKCRCDEEIAQEIQRVVRHEIAHHFGLDDESLYAIEAEKHRESSRGNETISCW